MHNDFAIKIGDFGLATVKSNWQANETFQQPTGSVLWMAPEIIRMSGNNPYSFKSDVYAYGIVVYELCTSTLPYKQFNNKDQILFMVGRGRLTPDLSLVRESLPKLFIEMMKNCIQFDPELRPLFLQILSEVENIMNSLPKFDRSQSEPCICSLANDVNLLSISDYCPAGVCPMPADLQNNPTLSGPCNHQLQQNYPNYLSENI